MQYQEDVASAAVGGKRAEVVIGKSDGRPEPADEDLLERSPRIDLTAEEALRAEVFEEYLAKAADNDFHVSRFRGNTLGGRPLHPSSAHRLIRSAAAQALPANWFLAQGVPLVDHEAQLVDYQHKVNTGRFSVDRATIRITWPGNTGGTTETYDSLPYRDGRLRMLAFVNEDGRAETIPVWSNSVLGELQGLVARLTERLPWQEAQATRYVLTGEPPAVPQVRMQYRWEPARVLLDPDESLQVNRALITLRVAPWISEGTVRKIHRDIQGRALGQRDNRRVGTKALKLLRFVIERENPIGLTPSRRRRVGRQLVEAWDQANPHLAFFGKYRQPTSEFWKTYERARILVTEPCYVPPNALRQGNQVS